MSSILHLFENFLWVQLFLLIKTELYQYHTKYTTNNGDHTCFYRHSIEYDGRGSYLIPYCIRTPMISQLDNDFPCFGQNLTFDELKKKNITSDQLLKWFAPLDLITDYLNYMTDGVDGSQLFCNCSEYAYSFGTHCQYEFATKTFSFNKIVNATMSNRYLRDVRNLTEEYDMTCYTLSNCTSQSGVCLDWRQICDGRVDCTNGIDEDLCIEKEVSECNERTHYRCRSGHCIPRAFAFDLTIDCSEADDEQYRFSNVHRQSCRHSFSSECDERSCGFFAFSCGDGVCLDRPGYHDENSKCQSQRDLLWLKRIYGFRGDLSKECWSHMICHIQLSCLFESPNVSESVCRVPGKRNAQFCQNLTNQSISCSNNGRIFFPRPSFVYPFLHTMYRWDPYTPREDDLYGRRPRYLCVNDQMFIRTRNSYLSHIPFETIDNYSCYSETLYNPLWYSTQNGDDYGMALLSALSGFLPFYYPSNHSHSQVFRCRNDVEISDHRLLDSVRDCLYSRPEDEFMDIRNKSCQIISIDRFAYTFRDNITGCLPRRLLSDGVLDIRESQFADLPVTDVGCYGYDERFPIRCTNEYDCQFYRDVSLQGSLLIIYEELCNGVRYCSTSSNENDEIDCDQWPCHTRAHRCNGIWNRLNGCDELNCFDSTTTYLSQKISNCSNNEHYCLRFNQTDLSCLSVEQAGDGQTDCVLAMDERMEILKTDFVLSIGENSIKKSSYGVCHNSNETIDDDFYICNGVNDCPFGDEELWCPWSLTMNCSFDEFPCKNGTCISRKNRCDQKIDCWPHGEDEWICDIFNVLTLGNYRPFTLIGFDTELPEKTIQSASVNTENDVPTNDEEMIEISDSYALFHCHRGILLRSRDGHDVCLCPPSYYGHRCQFQSNRLYVTFRSEMPPIFDQNTIYHLVFVLFNENHQVLSLETLIHMPREQSALKQSIYLLYSHVRNTSLYVHIEAYRVSRTEIEDSPLSWYYPVQFPFLPINRLSAKLDLELISSNKSICHRLGCVHGQCIFYVNTLDKHFCSCEQGWTGVRCDERLNIDPCNTLNCDAKYSKCVRHENRSICLCKMGRIGHTCRIPYNPCDRIRCENGGQCIAINEPSPIKACLCSIDYYGNRCQFQVARLIIKIPRRIEFIPVMIVHFLQTFDTSPGVLSHRNTFFFRNIHPKSELIVRDYQQQYLPSIILLQTFVDPSNPTGSYFLLALLNDNRTSLTKSISVENRCLHVSERLNETMMNFNQIKRAKFYHLYFGDVRCFYDEIYMCLVDQNKQVDCLIFNYNVAECTDRNYCENNGRCIQNKRAGQIHFACLCAECYYGSFCQLTMTRYSLTLDSMLGQEITANQSFFQQNIFIKILSALLICMFVIGMISNFCSTWTFSHVTIRQHGCGFYLFILSISSQISLTILLLRFIYLIIKQMIIIKNDHFLRISCILFDFLLQLSISFCDWLSSFVACERAMNVIKGLSFDKKLSLYVAKCLVPTLFLILILASTHQIFSRELIPDPRLDERLWCIVRFSYDWMRHYDAFINLFNTIIPFLINLISTGILLFESTRIKQKLHKKLTSRTILRQQINEHRDLIVSPIVMIILKLPLVLSILLIKCIKSEWQLFLLVTCYFLSNMSLIATFLIFILPSSSYMKIFKEKLSKLCQNRSNNRI